MASPRLPRICVGGLALGDDRRMVHPDPVLGGSVGFVGLEDSSPLPTKTWDAAAAFLAGGLACGRCVEGAGGPAGAVDRREGRRQAGGRWLACAAGGRTGGRCQTPCVCDTPQLAARAQLASREVLFWSLPSQKSSVLRAKRRKLTTDIVAPPAVSCASVWPGRGKECGCSDDALLDARCRRTFPFPPYPVGMRVLELFQT